MITRAHTEKNMFNTLANCNDGIACHYYPVTSRISIKDVFSNNY